MGCPASSVETALIPAFKKRSIREGSPSRTARANPAGSGSSPSTRSLRVASSFSGTGSGRAGVGRGNGEGEGARVSPGICGTVPGTLWRWGA